QPERGGEEPRGAASRAPRRRRLPRGVLGIARPRHLLLRAAQRDRVKRDGARPGRVPRPSHGPAVVLRYQFLFRATAEAPSRRRPGAEGEHWLGLAERRVYSLDL